MSGGSLCSYDRIKIEIKMKNRFIYLIILMLNAALSGCGDKGCEIYVSPDGNDRANGKLSTPVASLQRAAALAREKALKEEKPVISGGISVRNWKQEDDGSWSALLPPEFDGKFKIITYNVWQGYIDGEHPRFPIYSSGQKRKEEIYRWLKEQNPDVIFFQELIDYTGDKLMAESRFWGHQYAVTLRDRGMAVGFSSRYPIEVKEILTEGMHHGLIYCSVSGVDIIGTHLWPRFDDRILDEVKIVGKRVNESLRNEKPVIVLGDFNAFSPQDDPYIDSTTINLYRKWNWELENGRPSYRVIQELLGLGMKDVCVKFEKNSAARKLRYDFIFVSSGLAVKCTDATHYKDQEFLKLSDHFPVTASFEIDK